MDESGLVVARVGRKTWTLARVHDLSLEEREYLDRHGLSHARFSSRARASEAVRLALRGEPRRAEPLTRWKRAGEGVYLSVDGHWQLQRRPGEGCFLPTSEWAETGARGLREQGNQWLLSWRVDYTLYLCAHRADRLNQLLAAF